MFHPTLKFTAEYSKEEVNFLDLNIKLTDGELNTDLFVKPTDTHQFLDLTSSHAYHCKKGITCSKTLRLNSICSDNENFDKRCIDLQHSRNDLLEREKPHAMSEQKLTSNITYYQNV